MRFGFITLLTCLMGCTPLLAYAQTPPSPVFRRAGTQDIPRAPENYSLTKLIQNLGQVSALAIIDHDIFVAEKDTGRILRLRDQNHDGIPDIKTVFLIGFTSPQSMVVDGKTLYISDAQGVWEITPEKTLNTTQSPNQLLRFRSPSAHPLALNSDTHTLIIGAYTRAGISEGQVLSLDIATKKTGIIARGPWEAVAFTLTPNQRIWGALQMNGETVLVDVGNFQGLSENTLRLPTSAVEDLILWEDHLFVSQSAPQPAIIKFGFSYGELTPAPEAFLQGFSSPSYHQGKISIWGQPTAMTTAPNGDLIFADARSGVLWRVKPSAASPKPLIAVPKPSEILKPNVPEPTDEPTPKKTETPVLLQGSGITSASALAYGSGIDKDPLLQIDKFSHTEIVAKPPEQPKP